MTTKKKEKDEMGVVFSLTSIFKIFVNEFPTVIFCFLWGVHPLVWLVFLAWRLEETYETHSGLIFSSEHFHFHFLFSLFFLFYRFLLIFIDFY